MVNIVSRTGLGVTMENACKQPNANDHIFCELVNAFTVVFFSCDVLFFDVLHMLLSGCFIRDIIYRDHVTE